MELEFSDAVKENIILPKGYKWTDNKFNTFINSDGSRVTTHGKVGGEINTRPFRFCKEDLYELQSFIKHLQDNNASLLWNTGFDAHLYARDLGLENLKKIFLLSYYVSPYLKKIFDLGEWFETKYLCPTPTYDVVRKVMELQDLDKIGTVFVNGSHRGHIRYYINFVPLTTIGTIEFRIFNSSFEFRRIMETIKFMYRFVRYAISHTEEDFKNLDNVGKCCKAFKVNMDYTPKKHCPLIFAEEHTINTTVVGENFKKSKGMMNWIINATKDAETVHIVNSVFMDIEQVLSGKNIVVYTKEAYIKTAYDIILNDLKIKFSHPLDFLRPEEGEKAERLAKLFFFEKAKRSTGQGEYAKKAFKEYVDNKDAIITRLTKRTEKVVERLATGKIKVVVGDIYDAINNCKEHDVLIYQSEFNQKIRSTSNALQTYAGIELERFPTEYNHLDLSGVNYIVLSKNKYLFNLRKAYKDNREYIYSNIDHEMRSKIKFRTINPPQYKKLPMDFEVKPDTKLRFIRTKGSVVDYLRMIYLKKDILLGSGIFYHLWFLDDYLFGATIFDYSKEAAAAGDIVWMKSDFVINSNVPKLSKLLIMGVLSKEFQRELNIKYKTTVEKIATTVFSDKPVSMKYRGIFDLDKRQGGKLYYKQVPGKFESNDEVIKEYLKRFSK